MCVACPLPIATSASGSCFVSGSGGLFGRAQFPVTNAFRLEFQLCTGMTSTTHPQVDPTCPSAPTHTLSCHNYDGAQIATPTKYARQLLRHSIRLRSTPRAVSLPLWLYKLSPCAGCASHANQISVGLIKNRSRDLQASQYWAQLSSAPTSPTKVTTNCSRTRLLYVQNLILSSCCRHVWLLHVVWRCGTATAAACVCAVEDVPVSEVNRCDITVNFKRWNVTLFN